MGTKVRKLNDMKIIHFMLKTVKIIVAVILVLFLSGIILNIRPYIVLSGSMESTVHTGSLCLIKTDYDFEKVKVNDIIAFQKSKTMITHRVIRIDNEQQTFITKGDANSVLDNGFVDKNSFRGLNVFAVPYLGYAVDFLQKPVVFGSIFAVFCLMTVVADLNKWKKEKRKGAFYV